MPEDQTHPEYMSDGYSVIIQHCEACGAYLGVNYPSSFCVDCTPSPLYLASQYLINKEKES